MLRYLVVYILQLNQLLLMLHPIDDDQVLLTHLDETTSSLQMVLAAIEKFKAGLLHTEEDSLSQSYQSNDIEEVSESPGYTNVSVKQLSIDTFFSSCDTSFGDVLSAMVLVDGDSMIPLTTFLSACQSYLQFFERFSGTLLSPLKNDLQGNMNKIKKAISKSDARMEYIQVYCYSM